MSIPSGISVIIPVYNSAVTLHELINQLGTVLPTLASSYEAILINDGSRDKSWEIIQEICKTTPWVRGVNMMRNYGQHNALVCGMRLASFDITVTMDDDLQHPPAEIHKLLSPLAEGNDVVYGIPKKLPHSWWRNVFSRMTKRILAMVMGIPTIRDIGAFRAFRTEIRRASDLFQSPTVILDVLLSWGTTRFATVEVDEAPRQVGHSNYNFSRLVSQALLILTGFSTVPLRMTNWLGFIATFFGFLVLLYVLIQYFMAGSIPGFPFLASLVAIFSGVQLFALGIFGEYLARIFDRSMERPTYVISEQISSLKDKSS
ncbi:glycosyl transferase [Leptolinea tardivitalis]|uniref:Glycosyl transferase n=2 Tax=Leptolinea tardivitalis TaxID=229920 RepID=A0A0P6X0U3_9CHLR|nr:glycosyl transferase [Leptolinea tardivitalis]